jgi:ketosteroid isomerase-like protein
MRRLLLILSLLLIAATPAAAQPSDGPAEIKAVISGMQDAWNRGDFRGYMAGFWNPGVRFVSKGRMITGWQQTLDHYIRDYDTPAKRGTLKFWDVEVEMLGPDVAQMTGRYKLDSQGLAQDGVNTRLFRRIGGKWVIVLNHVSSREEAPATAGDAAAEIRAVMDRQVAAWNVGDIDGFMAGYWNSPELRFVSGTSVTTGWAETLARYKKRYDTPEKRGHLAFSDIQVTPLGPDAAVVYGRWAITGVKSADGLFTLTFRKIGGNWVIVLDHTS